MLVLFVVGVVGVDVVCSSFEYVGEILTCRVDDSRACMHAYAWRVHQTSPWGVCMCACNRPFARQSYQKSSCY